MKVSLVLVSLLVSVQVFAAGSGDTVNGLKLNDHQGRKIASEQDIKNSLQGIDPAKLKEIQQQLESYQKQQKEQQKYLDELMNE